MQKYMQRNEQKKKNPHISVLTQQNNIQIAIFRTRFFNLSVHIAIFRTRFLTFLPPNLLHLPFFCSRYGNSFSPRVSLYPSWPPCFEASPNRTMPHARLDSYYNRGGVQCCFEDSVFHGRKPSEIRQRCQTTVSTFRPSFKTY